MLPPRPRDPKHEHGADAVTTLVPAAQPDYGKSVPFRFDRGLSEQFRPLGDWMTGQVFNFYRLGIPKGKTFTQISAAVYCILANLIEANQISPDCFIAISRREKSYTKSRYLNVDFGYDNFIRVLDFLQKSDPPFVIFKEGFFDRRTNRATGFVSRYAPSDKFIQLIHGYAHVIGNYADRYDFSMNDVVNASYAYTKSKPLPATRKADLLVSPIVFQAYADIIRLRDSNGNPINYEDSELTTQMRTRLQQWNDFISQHHLVDLLLTDYELENVFQDNGDDDEDEAFFKDEQQSSYAELDRTRLHRVFNNSSFEQGGRFYGGWWQAIPSRYRRYITINEHATREFDYSNLHAAMLYAMEGLSLPDDAYSLPRIPENYRKLIKKTFFKLINAGPDQVMRAPKAGTLPPGWTWAQLQEAIKEKHAPISKYLHSGIGLILQRTDSDIAETVMLRMMEKDILVLPVHDSFITYHELQTQMRDEMARAYKEKMESDIGIKADDSFIDQWNEEAQIGVEFDAEDVVDNVRSYPGYDGFRERYRNFISTRDGEWHHRFG